jgi:ethanolamine utilization protein EutA
MIRLEKGGRRFLAALGEHLDFGAKVSLALREALASRMAHALFHALTTGKPPWDDFFVAPGLATLPKIDGILFSGGVSEYIYARENDSFGDLGPYLGREIRREAEQRGLAILEAGEGIRATVIGASQYTVQLSGETIFVPIQVEQ